MWPDLAPSTVPLPLALILNLSLPLPLPVLLSLPLLLPLTRAKSIAYLRLEPSLVTVRQVAYQRHVVEVVGTVYLAPKRSWLVPASLLLPVEVPIRATIKLGVSGPLSTGKVRAWEGRDVWLGPCRVQACLFNHHWWAVRMR